MLCDRKVPTIYSVFSSNQPGHVVENFAKEWNIKTLLKDLHKSSPHTLQKFNDAII